jgi:hypothetical protein
VEDRFSGGRGWQADIDGGVEALIVWDYSASVTRAGNFEGPLGLEEQVCAISNSEYRRPVESQRAASHVTNSEDESGTTVETHGGSAPPFAFVANDWPSAPLVLWLEYHYRRLNDASAEATSSEETLDQTASTEEDDGAEGSRLVAGNSATKTNNGKATATTPLTKFPAIPKPILPAVWDNVAKGLRGAKIAFCLHNGTHQGIFAPDAFPRLRLPLDVLTALRWPQAALVPKASGSPSSTRRSLDKLRRASVYTTDEEGLDNARATAAPPEHCTLNWVAAALLECDLRLTVSPGYAAELQESGDLIPAQAVLRAGGIR